MADSNLLPELKTSLSPIRTRRTMAFAYGFMLIFMACTILLLFNPSAYAPGLFRNIFRSSLSQSSSSHRSQFSSIFSYIFLNSSTLKHSNHTFYNSQNTTFQSPLTVDRSNLTALTRNNSSVLCSSGNERTEENWLDSMMHCDIFDGKWVRDYSYPLYAAGSCPHIDEPFNCYLNNRPDSGYQNYRWQPKGCNIPRLVTKSIFFSAFLSFLLIGFLYIR